MKRNLIKISNIPAAFTMQPDQGVLHKLNAFLDENLTHLTLTPDALCKQIGLSRSQLHRLLKEKTQLSVTLYLRKKRLDKAKNLLLETDMRVSEIAYLVGIDSPQNFSKYFAEAFNVSATEFRSQTVVEKSAAPAQPARKASIAVLPFLNLSNDMEQEFFSDGVTEEIINVLSRTPNLQVAGRTSSFTFKGKNQDLRLIGEQLNVDHILEGSVRKSGNKLRIAAKLINVADGYNVWSEHYDRELEDIFDIQDEIALAILREIKVQLLGDELGNTFKRYTNNTTAYQLYLHGRFYHNKFAGIDEFNKAITYFQSAIEVEPNYAIAYAGIASCYLNMWFYRHLPAAYALAHMKQATEHALALDSGIAESVLALARMQMLYEWDFAGASAAFKKALELNWSTADLHGQYALYWALTGNLTKAEEQTALALSLEPFSLINNFYAGYVYWIAGNLEKAIEQGRKLVALEPAFWGGHMILGLNLITLKNYPAAQDALEAALEINYNGITLSACGALFGLSGETESARDILTQMTLLTKTQVVAHYDMGIVHACLGDTDTALGYFQAAIDEHEPPMLFFKFIFRDWLSKSGNDARYGEIISQIIK
ncbi:helix-turn-helix domain-containing protein [Dyadobacter pollutisoli]|uniref:Helix-turn-helix domain-containing protein n=1 Tax=Dyadobacter pollutisoli TaxID=2910158 RepID=A0A9E8NB05_9BACT|nr:helix-turn-helix domain-containing protein [Dyadobacter pollutisoli]WAC12638.1 helix-turn-helix domain-containing protein [Dyadobacter pollutisoli]